MSESTEEGSGLDREGKSAERVHWRGALCIMTDSPDQPLARSTDVLAEVTCIVCRLALVGILRGEGDAS